MLLSNNCIEREERESYHVYVFVDFTPLFTTPLPPKTNTQQQQQQKKTKKKKKLMIINLLFANNY